MKRITTFIMFLSVCILSCGADTKGLRILEARNFLQRADWRGFSMNGWAGLTPSYSDKVAATIIEMPEAGEYNVWIRAYDFAQDPGGRKIKVIVNDDESLLAGPNKSIKKDGFVWDNIGKTFLNKGVNFVFLKKISAWARIDAILFAADDNYKPDRAIDTRAFRAKIHAKVPNTPDKFDTETKTWPPSTKPPKSNCPY